MPYMDGTGYEIIPPYNLDLRLFDAKGKSSKQKNSQMAGD